MTFVFQQNQNTLKFRKCSKAVRTSSEVFGKVQKAPENLQKTSGVHWDSHDRGKAKI